MAAGGHSSPYDWIPASAGMTEEVQEETSCRGLGCPHIFFLISPKIGGFRGLKQSVTDPLYHACVGMARRRLDDGDCGGSARLRQT
jgi:hypothetical protein